MLSVDEFLCALCGADDRFDEGDAKAAFFPMLSIAQTPSCVAAFVDVTTHAKIESMT